MKIKFFVLLAGIVGTLCFCFWSKETENQKKVEKAVFSAAVETAQKVLDAAQNKNSRAFIELSFDFAENRNGYCECYQLLQNIRPPENAEWVVREDINNGCINVGCHLDKKHLLLIVLKPQPDNSMKFIYACTMNS